MVYEQLTLEGQKIISLDELTKENADNYAEVHPEKFAEELNDTGVFYNEDCNEKQLAFARSQLKEIFGTVTQNMLNALMKYGAPCNRQKKQAEGYDLTLEDDEEDPLGIFDKFRTERNIGVFPHTDSLGIMSH